MLDDTQQEETMTTPIKVLTKQVSRLTKEILLRSPLRTPLQDDELSTTDETTTPYRRQQPSIGMKVSTPQLPESPRARQRLAAGGVVVLYIVFLLVCALTTVNPDSHRVPRFPPNSDATNSSGVVEVVSTFVQSEEVVPFDDIEGTLSVPTAEKQHPFASFWATVRSRFPTSTDDVDEEEQLFTQSERAIKAAWGHVKRTWASAAEVLPNSLTIVDEGQTSGWIENQAIANL